MATTLINLTNRSQVFHLTHPKFYLGVWGFHRQTVRTSELNPRTGNVLPREQRKAMPGTLTLAARNPRKPGSGKVEGLPDEIAQVEDVKRAVRAGKVKLVATADEPAPPKPKPKASKPKRSRNSGGSAETEPAPADD